MKTSPKNLIIIGILAVLLITIPLTLFFVKQQQDLRSKAAPSSTLSMTTAQASLPVGQTFSVDVMLDPGNNIPSFVKFSITFDPKKLELTQITPDTQNITSTLAGPVIASNSATIDLGISKALTGYDPTATFNQPFKVATIKFLAKEKTEAPTQVTFNFPGQTEVYSLSSSDSPGENVLQNATPIMLTILDGGSNPSPTATPSSTITPTLTIAPTISPTQLPNTSPVCTSLSATPASGSAPLTTQFTAVGNDPDGTISKATFNFGNGQVVDVVNGLGIKNVSVQQSHTYATANNYTVSVVLTDNRGGTSIACTQTVIVSAGQSGNSGDQSQVTPTTVAVQPTTPPAIEAPGSLGTTLGVIGAVMLTVVGTILFFAL
jgi:PKD repeat protein